MGNMCGGTSTKRLRYKCPPEGENVIADTPRFSSSGNSGSSPYDTVEVIQEEGISISESHADSEPEKYLPQIQNRVPMWPQAFQDHKSLQQQSSEQETFRAQESYVLSRSMA